MSDINSSLPIRTEQKGDVSAKIVDFNGVNELKVEADGSINTNSTIDGVSTLAEQQTQTTHLSSIDSKLTSPLTVQATDLDVRDLAFATDKVDVTGSTVALDSTSLAALENITATVSGPIALDSATLAALENISIDNFPANQTVNGTVELGATTLAALESITATVSGTVELGATTLAALETITVQATDLDVRDLAFATDKVDVTGSKVTITETVAIVDFDSDANVAVNGTSTHTYTATANYHLEQIECSGSGAAKFEISIAGTPKFVLYTSAATLNTSLRLEKPILLTSGQTVVITKTNRDKGQQDLHSTILGTLA